MFVKEHHGYTSYSSSAPSGDARSLKTRKRFYHQEGLRPPRGYLVTRLSHGCSLRVVFTECDQGRFLITAPNLTRAYEVMNAVDGIFALTVGHAVVDADIYRLNEVSRMPRPEWTFDQLLSELRERSPWITEIDALDLRRHVGVGSDVMSVVGYCLPWLLADTRLTLCLRHLSHSRMLFYGHMVESYYWTHYRRDRKRHGRASHRRRDYLDHRERFELAFLAGFKAIEALFGVNQIRAADVVRVITRAGHVGLSPQLQYTKRFELGAKAAKRISIKDYVSDALVMRNAVAGHANASPPKHLTVTRESVYEIQRCVAEMCKIAMGPVGRSGLPRGAAVRRRTVLRRRTVPRG